MEIGDSIAEDPPTTTSKAKLDLGDLPVLKRQLETAKLDLLSALSKQPVEVRCSDENAMRPANPVQSPTMPQNQLLFVQQLRSEFCQEQELCPIADSSERLLFAAGQLSSAYESVIEKLQNELDDKELLVASATTTVLRLEAANKANEAATQQTIALQLTQIDDLQRQLQTVDQLAQNRTSVIKMLQRSVVDDSVQHQSDLHQLQQKIIRDSEAHQTEAERLRRTIDELARLHAAVVKQNDHDIAAITATKDSFQRQLEEARQLSRDDFAFTRDLLAANPRLITGRGAA